MSHVARRVLGALHRRISPDYYRYKKYLSHARVLSGAPYSVDFYRELLGLISSSQAERFCDFGDLQESSGSRRWFVRHDLDEPACLVRAPLMIELDLRFGAVPGVFLRVDSDSYQLSSAKSFTDEFRRDGVVFGLHSECYLRDDWQRRLEEEVTQFRDVLGFAPFGINAHGLGDYRWDVRQRFYEGLTAHTMKKLGVTLNDCGTGPRRYAHCIQDCHLVRSTLSDATTESVRCILSDFRVLPPSGWGRDCLVLTHPCYWTFPD